MCENKKRKKEDPKKVYARLKRYRQRSKLEKLEITGIDPELKEEFKNLKGLESATSANKLRRLMDAWNGNKIVLEQLQADNSETFDKNLKETEFNRLINEMVRLRMKIAAPLVQETEQMKLVLSKDEQFQLFRTQLKQEQGYDFLPYFYPEKIHNLYHAQIVQRVDAELERTLGKGRGTTYFILISKLNEPEQVFYNEFASLSDTLNFYYKFKFSRKQAKTKFDILTGNWEEEL